MRPSARRGSTATPEISSSRNASGGPSPSTTVAAEVIATSEIDARELDALYRWRDRYLSPSNRRPVLDVTRWREPEFGGHGFIDGLRAGGTLWYPTAAEAAELATELHRQQQQSDEAVLAGK